MRILRILFGKSPDVVPPAPNKGAAVSKPPINPYVVGAIDAAKAVESFSELSIFANDYSGYVRQAAVDRCAALARPELLSIIAGRLNDWVPAVRDAARAAMMKMCELVPPQQLLSTLPAIHHLHTAGRAEHAQWIELFETNLIRRFDLQDIVAATKGTDIKVARGCFHILRKYMLQDSITLLRLILAAGNDIVLASDAVQMVRDLAVEAQRPYYLLALKSRFGSVRTTALRGLLAVEDISNMELAASGLLDLQTSVRDVAAAFMRSKDVDIRRFYREVLERQPEISFKITRVALTSLAVLRNADDSALVKAYAAHPQLSVRRSALAAWIKISPGDKDEVALAALMDDAVPVRKFALQAVRKHGAYIPFILVRERLNEVGDLNLLLSFAESRVWDGLDCIVRAAMLDLSNAQRKQQLKGALREWIIGMGHRYEVASVSQQDFFRSSPVMGVFRDLLDNDKHLLKRLESELLA